MSLVIRTLVTPDRWPAFLRGMAAYGSAEAVTRIARLGAILVVARQISSEMLGTAALALSIFEIVRVLTNVGIGQRIIKSDKAELASICNTALRLFWIVCISVAGLQLAAAGMAWIVFGHTDVAAMLAALSAVYIFMPSGLVHIFLAMRAQRMGATARVAAVQNITDCALTVVLVIIWPSAWAIVLPKLLTAPVWMALARQTYKWQPDRDLGYAPIGAFGGYGLAILGSELLTAARLNCDKLLVAALLGTEALGLYFFAFNAGLGITQSLVSAITIVLFPHLAKMRGRHLEREFRRAFVFSLAILVPLVAAQALLAPFFVPIVFGEGWVSAIPYLSVLACAAIPLSVAALLGARFRALGRPHSETVLMAIATPSALMGVSIGATYSLMAACIGFGVGLTCALLPAVALHFSPHCPPKVDHLKGVI